MSLIFNFYSNLKIVYVITFLTNDEKRIFLNPSVDLRELTEAVYPAVFELSDVWK